LPGRLSDAPQLRISTVAQLPSQPSKATPFLRWLNQDVVYIITEEERAAFQRLSTDEQREQFVKQFWQRRNPKPNSTSNKFKQEHYRRIKYANQLFRTASGKPGWQTDRGRIYIVYGPPDEIESHPSGSPKTPYPFEVWRDWHVESVGDNLFITFLDRTRTGDYQRAPGNVQ
jgi:GWxTD domain-containing protein